ncbi:hypothetical protein ES703_16757 [subsurface metagenome]
MSKEYTRRIAILGNVPSHGPFVYFDNFEQLLKWTQYEGIGDAIFELDPTTAYSGNQSLYLKTRTTGATTNDKIGAEILLYMTPSRKLNQAIHFRSPDFTKIKRILFWFTLFDGSNQHYATVQFLPNDPLWQYRDFETAMQDIPDSAYNLLVNAWHRLQLQADLNTHNYISMIVDNHHHNLSTLGYYFGAEDTLTHFKIRIELHTIGSDPCELYIDDFLLHEL